MASTATSKRLNERGAKFSSSELRVDREAGIIHGVKFLGWESSNGRRYVGESRQDALSLYEGAAIKIDHGDGSVVDRNGQARDLEMREDGIYGDWHLNTKHALTEQFMEDAEKFSSNIMMSHEVGDWDERIAEDGVTEITRIKNVLHISVVGDGGTTKALNEGREMTTPEPKPKKRLNEESKAILAIGRLSEEKLKEIPAVAKLIECECNAAKKKESDLQEKYDALEKENSDLKKKTRRKEVTEAFETATSGLSDTLKETIETNDELFEEWAGIDDDAKVAEAIGEFLKPYLATAAAINESHVSDSQRLNEGAYSFKDLEDVDEVDTRLSEIS